MKRLTVFARRSALVAIAVAAIGTTAASGASRGAGVQIDKPLQKIDHIVVIYEENHSFDNLYGGWEGVNGRANADAAHTSQLPQVGSTPYTCLKQNDVNLNSPPLTATCTNTTPAFASHFVNAPFLIDDYLSPSDTTCPPNPLLAFSSPNGFAKGTGSPGGCTRDLVHRFYQEQYQLNGGQQNHYTTGSDAVGLTQGVYDTQALPIYEYLHAPNHVHYAIADDFFQSAFGGSFLNHQWLIAAATPTWSTITATQHSLVDSNGFPNATYPLYTPTGPVRDAAGTVACPSPIAGLACGDYAVNTTQPQYQPSGAFGAKIPAQTNPTIGDRLNTAGVDWAWYAGGWSNANGDVNAPGWTNGNGPTCSDPYADPLVSSYPRCPNNVFQYHHQPFNYYAAFNPSTASGLANRTAHLKDEQEFIQLANGSGKDCGLKAVSFIKPFGTENEHPGYASEPGGSDHLVALLQAIESGACAKNTMVIVTYDEFGGQWDHVAPPGQAGTVGPHDVWGPGTRIPALIVSPFLHGNFVVDHTQYDTTSILATIEHRYGLTPLSTRDAAVNDLGSVFSAKQYEAAG
jgi:acid phosphatase